MSLEEFKNIEDLYKAKTFGTIQLSHRRQKWRSTITNLIQKLYIFCFLFIRVVKSCREIVRIVP